MKWMIWSDRQKYASLMNLMRSLKHIQMSASVCEASWNRPIRKTYFKKRRSWEWEIFSVNKTNGHRVSNSNNNSLHLMIMGLISRPSYRSIQISKTERIYTKRPPRTILARFQSFVNQHKAQIWPSTTQYTRFTVTLMWLSSLVSFKKTRSLISRSSYLCSMAKPCPPMPCLQISTGKTRAPMASYTSNSEVKTSNKS